MRTKRRDIRLSRASRKAIKRSGIRGRTTFRVGITADHVTSEGLDATAR